MALTSACRGPFLKPSCSTGVARQRAAFHGSPIIVAPGRLSFTAKNRRLGLRTLASESGDKAKKAVDDAERMADDIKSSASDRVNGMTGAAKSATDSVAGQIKDGVNSVSDEVKEVTQGAKRGGKVYGALAALFAASAVAKVAAPSAVLESVFLASGMSTTQAFMQLNGVFMLLPAAALWCLKGASDGGRLGSATYKRLNTALMIYGVGYAALAGSFIRDSALSTGSAMGVAIGVYVIMAAAAGHVLAKQDGGLFASLSELPSAIADLAKKPKSMLSGFYGFTGVVCAAMGGSLLALPSPTHTLLFNELLPLGLLSIALKKIIGLSLLTMGTTTAFILKDATERSRLGASTFKLLNIAFAGTCAGTFATLAHYLKVSVDAKVTAASGGMFIFLALACGVCGYQYSSATK